MQFEDAENDYIESTFKLFTNLNTLEHENN
jgi:hypothetical protein